MIGRTNIGGGGKALGAISVTYPEGSTCTCSNGTKTLRAKDTTGNALFLLPEVGAWNVLITDGSHSKTNSVEVGICGAYTVKIGYEKNVFYDGVLATEVGTLVHISGDTASQTSSEWEITSDNLLHIRANASQGSGNSVFKGFTNPVDFLGYSSLKIRVKGTGTVGYGSSNASSFTVSESVTDNDNYKDVTFDISGRQSEYYLIFQAVASAGYINRSMYISKIWLE